MSKPVAQTTGRPPAVILESSFLGFRRARVFRWRWVHRDSQKLEEYLGKRGVKGLDTKVMDKAGRKELLRIVSSKPPHAAIEWFNQRGFAVSPEGFSLSEAYNAMSFPLFRVALPHSYRRFFPHGVWMGTWGVIKEAWKFDTAKNIEDSDIKFFVHVGRTILIDGVPAGLAFAFVPELLAQSKYLLSLSFYDYMEWTATISVAAATVDSKRPIRGLMKLLGIPEDHPRMRDPTLTIGFGLGRLGWELACVAGWLALRTVAAVVGFPGHILWTRYRTIGKLVRDEQAKAAAEAMKNNTTHAVSVLDHLISKKSCLSASLLLAHLLNSHSHRRFLLSCLGPDRILKLSSHLSADWLAAILSDLEEADAIKLFLWLTENQRAEVLHSNHLPQQRANQLFEVMDSSEAARLISKEIETPRPTKLVGQVQLQSVSPVVVARALNHLTDYKIEICFIALPPEAVVKIISQFDQNGKRVLEDGKLIGALSMLLEESDGKRPLVLRLASIFCRYITEDAVQLLAQLASRNGLPRARGGYFNDVLFELHEVRALDRATYVDFLDRLAPEEQIKTVAICYSETAADILKGVKPSKLHPLMRHYSIFGLPAGLAEQVPPRRLNQTARVLTDIREERLRFLEKVPDAVRGAMIAEMGSDELAEILPPIVEGQVELAGVSGAQLFRRLGTADRCRVLQVLSRSKAIALVASLPAEELGAIFERLSFERLLEIVKIIFQHNWTKNWAQQIIGEWIKPEHHKRFAQVLDSLDVSDIETIFKRNQKLQEKFAELLDGVDDEKVAELIVYGTTGVGLFNTKIRRILRTLYDKGEAGKTKARQFFNYWPFDSLAKLLDSDELTHEMRGFFLDCVSDTSTRNRAQVFAGLSIPRAAATVQLLRNKKELFAAVYSAKPDFLPSVCEKLAEDGFENYEKLLADPQEGGDLEYRIHVLRALPKRQHYTPAVAQKLAGVFAEALAEDKLRFLAASGHDEILKYVATHPGTSLNDTRQALDRLPAALVEGSTDFVQVVQGTGADRKVVFEQALPQVEVKIRPQTEMTEPEFQEDRHLAWALYHGKTFMKNLRGRNPDFYNIAVDLILSLTRTIKAQHDYENAMEETFGALETFHRELKEIVGEENARRFFYSVLPHLDCEMSKGGIQETFQPLLDLTKILRSDPERQGVISHLYQDVLPALLSSRTLAETNRTITAILLLNEDYALPDFAGLLRQDAKLGLIVARGLFAFADQKGYLRKYLVAYLQCQKEREGN